MGLIIGFLTLVLVLDCVVLVFLVLIQLPKKEAGAGLAFGGAASDALFGAGSGTVLTKITKYAAGTFFVLAVALAMLQSQLLTRGTSRFLRNLDEAGRPLATGVNPGPTAAPTTPPATPGAPASAAAGQLTSTNLLMSSPVVEDTKLPPPTNTVPTPTNAAPAK